MKNELEIGNRQRQRRLTQKVRRSDRLGQRQLHRQTGVTVRDKDL